METITTTHWVLAIIFMVTFPILIFWAYKGDSKQTPAYFSAAKKSYIIIILFTILLIFIKFGHRILTH